MDEEKQESATWDRKTKTTTKKKTNRKRSEKKASKKVKFSTSHVLESIPTTIIKLDIPKSILKEKEEEKEEENNNIQSPVDDCSSQTYPRSSGHMIKSSSKKCNRNIKGNHRLKNKSRRKMTGKEWKRGRLEDQKIGKGEKNGEIYIYSSQWYKIKS